MFAVDTQGQRRELRVEEFWPHQRRMVLKFAGVDSISEAETLVGCEIQIPQAERVELEPGAAYVSDLVGCTVFALEAAGIRELGKVEDVDFSAGEAPLLVVRAGKRELLLPFATEFVKSLDTPAKRIEMVLPAGLLELDAPLSEEEKQQQRQR